MESAPNNSHGRQIGILLGVACAGCAVGVTSFYLVQRYSRRNAEQDEGLANSVHEIRRSVQALCDEIRQLRENVQALINNRKAGGIRSPDSSEDTFYDALETISRMDEVHTPTSIEQNGSILPTDSDNVMVAVRRAEELLKSESTDDRRQAYETMRDRYNELKENPTLIAKLARATYLYSQTFVSGDQEARKSLVQEARTYAFEALDKKADSAEVQKWCAITTGSLSDFLDTKARIENGHKFKYHIDEALRLSPEDHVLHHLLGRWCFAVAGLSWIERRVASMIFAAPPTSTFDEALTEFLKADALSTEPWLENKLYVAKCFLALSKNDTAIEWLKAASLLRPASTDDKAASKEVADLLSKLS